MKSLTLRALLAAVLIFVLAPSVSGAQTPAAPSVTYKSTIDGLTINGAFDLVNQIIDFPPGAISAVHVHGGQGLALVLAGEITFRPEGKAAQVAKPGDVYVDTPGVPHLAANTGSTVARLSFMVALPQGATLTTAVGSTPTANPAAVAPKVVYTSRYPGITMAGPFSMVNQIVDFPPNASTALHVHGGPGMATVLDGELVFRPEGKVNQPAKPGDVYLDVPGTPHRAVNEGSTPARLSFAVVVPQGAGVTTPLQQVSPPRQVQRQGQVLPNLARRRLGCPARARRREPVARYRCWWWLGCCWWRPAPAFCAAKGSLDSCKRAREAAGVERHPPSH